MVAGSGETSFSVVKSGIVVFLAERKIGSCGCCVHEM